jgi:NADH-quinone oxidoreductase subunit G
VAPVVEKAGTYLDWEGRERPFAEVLRGTSAMPDVRVLHALAEAMGIDLGLPDVAAARAEIAELGEWDGARTSLVRRDAVEPTRPGPGEAVLSTWALLLDAGRLQDDEPFLAGTARAAHARLSPATAAAVGVAEGDTVTVSTDRGAISVPAVLGPLPDGVVWLPTNSPGCAVRSDLAAGNGSTVRLSRSEGGDR